jgi:signal transduction histidine kinase
MSLSLRHRIALTLLPLLLLLAIVGTAGVVLLSRLGNSAGAILRENYDSVIAMERLNEALERIDSSFQFSLSGQQPQARRQFDEYWQPYRENLEIAQNNITLPGERELLEQLTQLSDQYQRAGAAFHESADPDEVRQPAYYGPSGLLQTFQQIKQVSGRIRELNQANMESASREARQLALESLVWFGVGLIAAILLAVVAAWHTVRTVLQPMQSMTQAALGIASGNLDQVVPYSSDDELGQLAQAFNSMARSLREFRQSQSARLLRVQKATQATVDSFPDPVIVLDTEGRVELANPAARRLLGVLPMQPGQTLAVPWQAPEPLRQPLAEALSDQRDYFPEEFDKTILLKSEGRERAALPRILTIRDPGGNTLGAAVLLQDVTRLRLLDQVKSNLVATASHELKTPLTSVRLAVHLLLEEQVGPLNAKQIELLLDARENSERLLAVVNNLLDLARLEQGLRQLNIRPERPEALLRLAADDIALRAVDQGIEVVLDIPPGLPLVTVDATRLQTALQNLLDNALRYTERGGRITLAAHASHAAVTISVTDTGLGIPPEYVPHVFEKFFRVPGRSRGHGTGLGLAIVHEIVTAQGGTITCQSAPQQGTTFRITLPIATDATPARGAEASSDPDSSPRAELHAS